MFSKRKKILIIILIFAFLLLAIGGIYLLTRSNSSKKSSEKEKKQSPIENEEEKIEFLVEFKEEMRSEWNFFTEAVPAENRLIFFIDKNHPAFQSLKLNSVSQYYLKILKSQKEKSFFGKNDWIELRKK